MVIFRRKSTCKISTKIYEVLNWKKIQFSESARFARIWESSPINTVNLFAIQKEGLIQLHYSAGFWTL